MTGSSGTLLRRSRPSPGQALTVACWLVALGVLGYLCYSGAVGPMRDLAVYRAGAEAVRSGHRLYAVVTDAGLPFTYPPLGAVLAVPLTLVPFPVARIAWDAMVCLPLVLVVWYGFRPLLARAGRGAPAIFALVLAGCALLFPVRQEFYFGQVDLFLVALCLLDLRPARTRWPRGVLIGLATAIKLEPGAFIVYLLITRRRKDAAVAAVSFVAWTALAWLVDSGDSHSYWTHEIFQTNRLGGNGSAANQSVRGLVLRAFKPHLAPSAVWLAIAVVVAVAGFFAAWTCWRRGNDPAGIAITGLLSAALSPVAWIHHFCWLVFALGVIVGDGRSRSRAAIAAAAAALFITSLPIQAQSLMRQGRLPVWPGRALEASLGLAALALIVVLYWIGRARGPTGGTEGPPLSAAISPEQLPSGTGQP